MFSVESVASLMDCAHPEFKSALALTSTRRVDLRTKPITQEQLSSRETSAPSVFLTLIHTTENPEFERWLAVHPVSPSLLTLVEPPAPTTAPSSVNSRA